MGLNRNLLMGQNVGQSVDLKNIKAMMTVGADFSRIGFIDGSLGSISPNPLPNGVLVTECYAVSNMFFLAPSSIKSCTINNITIKNHERNSDLFSYIQQNSSKTIPVIFHFD